MPARRAAHSTAAAAAAVFRVRAGCGRVARCYDGRAHPDGAAADCHRGADRRYSADCTAVVDRRHFQTHWRGELLEDLSLIRSSTRLKTLARSDLARRREKVRVKEVRVMSYCRAHRESVRRRVEVLKDPLAPDTDRHHRRIRERVVDCRTDGCAGRDEKDVGVRSCSCGVAEKKSGTRMAHWRPRT
jgi:hypothetical protein